MARLILLSLFASLYLYSVDAGGHHTTEQYKWPGEYYSKMTIREEAEVYKHGQEKHIDYFTLHQRFVRAGYTRAKSFYSFNRNVQSILAVAGKGMQKCYIFDQTIPFDSLETYLKDIEGEPEGTDFPPIMADSRVDKMTKPDVQTLLVEHPHITDVCGARWDYYRPTVMTGYGQEGGVPRQEGDDDGEEVGVPRQEGDGEGEEVGVPRQEGDDDGEGEYGHEGEEEGVDYHMKKFRVVGQDIKMKCPVYGN